MTSSAAAAGGTSARTRSSHRSMMEGMSSTGRLEASFSDMQRNGHVLECQWNLDHEHAAFIGNVSNVDVAPLFPDGLSGDRETETEARPVTSAALAERLERVPCARGDAAAFVFHFNQQPRVLRCPRTQHHPTVRERVLERVIQKVCHRRSE